MISIMKAVVVRRSLSAPVNDTLETSAPSFRKSNLRPLRSSWICTSDRGISFPNIREKADGYAAVALSGSFVFFTTPNNT